MELPLLVLRWLQLMSQRLKRDDLNLQQTFAELVSEEDLEELQRYDSHSDGSDWMNFHLTVRLPGHWSDRPRDDDYDPGSPPLFSKKN